MMNTTKTNIRNRDLSIDVIRIVSCSLIFLCHAFTESGTSYGVIFGQLFSVGVPIFFMISGFLYSNKDIPSNVSQWYLKRIRFILKPLYYFLILLLIVHISIDFKVDYKVWLFNFIPICGLTQLYINGCGHLWFITHIIICYLVTPFLQKNKMLIKKNLLSFLLVYVFLLFALSYTVPLIVVTLFASFGFYSIGYYLLPDLVKQKIHYMLLILASLLPLIVRVICRRFFDETPFYNLFITNLCSAFLATIIFIFIYKFCKDFNLFSTEKKKNILINLSNITYEFYLVHYVFLNGILTVNYFNKYWINVLFALILSIVCAMFLHNKFDVFIKKLRGGNGFD